MKCTNSCIFTLFSPGQVSLVFLKPLSGTKIPVAWLDTVDLIAWNDGASFLLLICLNRWSALSARSRWCYGQLIPSSILSIDEVSILIISELAGGMVCHCCYLHWLMAFFTSLSTTQFHNKLPSCFQYCITCRQSNKKSKNVSPDTKLLLLCQPGRVGNKADEPLNKWCFIKIHCKKLDNFNFLSILCF